MKLKFTIPGPPVAKQRGRMVPLQSCKACGRKTTRRQCICGSSDMTLVTVMNTPATATVQYENLVKLMASEAMSAAQIVEPTHETLRLEIEAAFIMPEARRCKKGCALAERGACKRLHDGDFHSQRPDADNIGKSVLDGMLKVVYYDDSQIAQLSIEKFWSATPRAVVTVETL